MRSSPFLLAALIPFAVASAYGCIESDLPVIPPEDEPDGSMPTTEGQGQLVLDGASIDWGFIACGSPPSSKTFQFKNVGGKAITYKILVEGSAFSVSGASEGTVEPGKTAELTVTATVDPGLAPRTTLEGALLVESDDPAVPNARVPLKAVTDGATLVITSPVVDFGEVRVGESAIPVSVTISNDGVAPIEVGLEVPTGSELGLSWTGVPESFTLGPRETQKLTATFAPQSDGDKSFVSNVTTKGALCGTGPKSVSLSGKGVYSPVVVSPSLIDLEEVDCGTAAAARIVTIQNDNAFAITFATEFASTSLPFTVSPASGSVPASGSTQLTITPKPLTQPRVLTENAYGDTLTVTTSAPEDTPHVVTLLQSARGALLSAALNGAFGTQPNGSTTNRTLTVNNTGNAPVTVRLSTAAPFSVNPASPTGITIAGGASGTATASFSPVNGNASSGSVSLSVTGPMCGPVPAALPMTGTGALPEPSYNRFATSFDATCGTTPGARAFVIENAAGAAGALLITNIATTGPFSVTPTSLAPIAPGGTATLMVRPNAPIFGTDRAGQIDDGTFSFRTNELGFPTESMTLARAVMGANLEYTDVSEPFDPLPQLDFFGCANGQAPVSANFMLANTGNQDVATLVGQSYATPFNSEFWNGQGQSTFGPVAAGSSIFMVGFYNGPFAQDRPAVNVIPVRPGTGVTNVCVLPALPMKYNLLSDNDRRCPD